MAEKFVENLENKLKSDIQKAEPKKIQGLSGDGLVQTVDTMTGQATVAGLGKSGGGSGKFKLNLDDLQQFVSDVTRLSSQNFDGSATPVATGRFERYSQISGGRFGMSEGATRFAQVFEEHRGVVASTHNASATGVGDLGTAVRLALQSYSDAEDQATGIMNSVKGPRSVDSVAAARINSEQWSATPTSPPSNSGSGAPPPPPPSSKPVTVPLLPPDQSAPPPPPPPTTSSSASSGDSLY